MTEKEMLEYAETIALACGWEVKRFIHSIECAQLGKMKPQQMTVDAFDNPVWEEDCTFTPFTDWNDAMRAADALGVEQVDLLHATPYDDTRWEKDQENKWMAECKGEEWTSGEQYHPDRLTAFVLALVEIAKTKMEDEG